MHTRHRQGRRLLASIIVGAALSGLAPHADSATRPVTLGEVTTRAETRVDARQFRQLVSDELGSLSLPDVQTPFVLSATLVRLHEQREKSEAVSRAKVSVTLRKKNSGDITALLTGSGEGRTALEDLPAIRADVVQAAVRSAMSRVPEAVQDTK